MARPTPSVLPLEQPPERLALDELHREEALALVLSDVERARHVLVGHAAGELHLTTEPLQHTGGVHELAAENLQRNDLVELRIPGAVDAPHPTYADEADELISGGDQERDGQARRVARGRGTPRSLAATTVSSVPVTFRSFMREPCAEAAWPGAILSQPAQALADLFGASEAHVPPHHPRGPIENNGRRDRLQLSE